MKDLNFLKNRVIAHRGFFNSSIPENSILAFENAIKNNFVIELDVHLIKDNTIIVFHDDNLFRMTGINKKVCDCTYDELKEVCLLNTDYKIPTLAEVLKKVDGKVPLIIELKYDRKVGLLEQEIVKLLDNYDGYFCVKSFNPLIVRWFKKNRPKYIRGLLISEKKKNIKERFCHSYLAYYLCKPDFISCNYKLYNDKHVNKYMKKGPVLAWTINNKINYQKYKNVFDNLILENIDKL